ncbi:MAG: flagellar assembly protein FliX [Hyphomonadaceae bacterium]
MKIESGRSVTGASPSRTGATTAAPGFTPAVDGPQRTAATTGVGAVTSLDAILALQGGIEPPAQRRARQARRGRAALDALEKLEQGLLSGRAPAGLLAELDSLQRAAEPTGDADLDAILTEIDIRLAVESAKLDRLAGRI